MRSRKHIVIETDVLVAALDDDDPHHSEASKIVKATRGCFLSPYTLTELDLLLRSGNIVVKDYTLFWHKLRDMLDHYNINVLTPNPLHYAEAGKLRNLYNLTYFDSLHAAAAIIEEKILISYDEKAYNKIENLKYIHPHHFSL